MNVIRAVIAGVEDNLLADIVQQVAEHHLALEVVARTNDRSAVPRISREQEADLILLHDASESTKRHRQLRQRLAGTALIVIGRNGRTACTCIDDPGIQQLVSLINAACGPDKNRAGDTA